jgi:putative membrane protein
VRRFEAALLVLLAAVYAWSAFRPASVPTWWMETAPVFAALPLLLAAHRRLHLTRIVLLLLAIEAAIVAVGAHYTYANVPIGFRISDLLGLERNHYDRFAHFFQGVFPSLLFRELLLKTSGLRRGGWLFFVVSAICLSFSAIYELIEWGAAVLFAEGATAFLGTQGDPWDTQWDMFLALNGSILAQLFLATLHDRQLGEQVNTRPAHGSEEKFHLNGV